MLSNCCGKGWEQGLDIRVHQANAWRLKKGAMQTPTGRASGWREQPAHRLESLRRLGAEVNGDGWEACMKGECVPGPAGSLGHDAAFDL